MDRGFYVPGALGEWTVRTSLRLLTLYEQREVRDVPVVRRKALYPTTPVWWEHVEVPRGMAARVPQMVALQGSQLMGEPLGGPYLRMWAALWAVEVADVFLGSIRHHGHLWRLPMAIRSAFADLTPERFGSTPLGVAVGRLLLLGDPQVPLWRPVLSSLAMGLSSWAPLAPSTRPYGLVGGVPLGNSRPYSIMGWTMCDNTPSQTHPVGRRASQAVSQGSPVGEYPPRKETPKSTHARRRPGQDAPSNKHELCDRTFTFPRRRPRGSTHASPSYPVRSPQTLQKPPSDTLKGPSENPPLRAYGASLRGGRPKLRTPP